MPLPTRADVAAFHEKLQSAYGKVFDLHINDNTSSLITLRHPRGGKPRLSIHRMFLQGGGEIIHALAQYMKRPTDHSRGALRRFMDDHIGEVQPHAGAMRRRVLRARGRNRDLNAIAAEVNRQYFGGQIAAHITFGRAPARRGAFSNISFGSYDSRLRIIRIHPMLDLMEVPDYFVAFVIFHEMLHAQMDPEHNSDGRRRNLHSAEFRTREALHPDYVRVKAWEARFIEDVSKGKWPEK